MLNKNLEQIKILKKEIENINKEIQKDAEGECGYIMENLAELQILENELAKLMEE